MSASVAQAREKALRIRQELIDASNGRVNELARIIGEFDTIAIDLEQQILAEENRTGVSDRSGSNYSSYARAAAQRSENIKTSRDVLREQLQAAIRERDEALRRGRI